MVNLIKFIRLRKILSIFKIKLRRGKSHSNKGINITIGEGYNIPIEPKITIDDFKDVQIYNEAGYHLDFEFNNLDYKGNGVYDLSVKYKGQSDKQKECKYPNRLCSYIEGGIVGELCDYCK